MYPISQIPPDHMTPEERQQEIASLLANGLLRLRERSLATLKNSEFDSGHSLGFAGQKSVHSNRIIPLTAEDL